MKSKTIISLLVLFLVASALVSYAMASFTDEVVVEDNEFAAGTLMLDVQNKPEGIDSFKFINIKPGDTGGWDGVSWDTFADRLEWDITNTGTLDGIVTISIENIVDKHWPEPRDATDAGNPTLVLAGSGDPRLSTQIRPQVRVNGVWKTESSGFNNLNPFTHEIPAGETINVRIAWSMYSSAGNEYQGATSEFDVKFFIEQQ